MRELINGHLVVMMSARACVRVCVCKQAYARTRIRLSIILIKRNDGREAFSIPNTKSICTTSCHLECGVREAVSKKERGGKAKTIKKQKTCTWMISVCTSVVNYNQLNFIRFLFNLEFNCNQTEWT